MTAWRERYVIELPADLLAGRQAVQSALSWLVLQGHPAESVKAWRLPLTEAVNNAILHGHRTPTRPGIQLSAATSAEGTEISITDGGYYVPAPLAAELPAHSHDDHGRGTFLISHGVDSAVHHNDASGHTLTLRWERRPTRAAGLVRVGQIEQDLDLLAQRLGDAYESVTAYSEFAGLLATTSDFAEILAKVRLRLEHTVPHQHFVLRMAQGDTLALVAPAPDFPATINLQGDTLEARAARTRACQVCPSAADAPPGDPLRIASGPVLIVASGSAHGRCGTLTLIRPAGAAAFTAGQISFAQAVADFLGTAQNMADLWSRRSEQLKLEQELKLAAKLQASLLPQHAPELSRWRIAGLCQPSRAMGGDYYDWIPQADGSCLVLVADVMGKGMPAALVASILRSSWRALAAHTKEPAELMTALNQQLGTDLASLDVFITAVLVRLQSTGPATYASAGHCPLLQFSARTGAFVRHSAGGPPLGILSSAEFPAADIELDAGDALYAFTDGCYEVDRSLGFETGLRRFEQELRDAAALAPVALATQVLRRLEAMAQAELPDDCTLVAMHQFP